MMQLKHWVEDLQRMVVLDENTGFLASLEHYVRVPAGLNDEEKKFYLIQYGTETREQVKTNMLQKIIHKLYLKCNRERRQERTSTIFNMGPTSSAFSAL